MLRLNFTWYSCAPSLTTGGMMTFRVVTLPTYPILHSLPRNHAPEVRHLLRPVVREVGIAVVTPQRDSHPCMTLAPAPPSVLPLRGANSHPVIGELGAGVRERRFVTHSKKNPRRELTH